MPMSVVCWIMRLFPVLNLSRRQFLNLWLSSLGFWTGCGRSSQLRLLQRFKGKFFGSMLSVISSFPSVDWCFCSSASRVTLMDFHNRSLSLPGIFEPRFCSSFCSWLTLPLNTHELWLMVVIASIMTWRVSEFGYSRLRLDPGRIVLCSSCHLHSMS